MYENYFKDIITVHIIQRSLKTVNTDGSKH